MYDVTQTKRPSGQNADNLILISHIISFKKSLSPKFPGRRDVAPILAHGLLVFITPNSIESIMQRQKLCSRVEV